MQLAFYTKDGRINLDVAEEIGQKIGGKLFITAHKNEGLEAWAEFSRIPPSTGRRKPGVEGTLLEDEQTRRYGFWGKVDRDGQRQIGGEGYAVALNENTFRVYLDLKQPPIPMTDIFPTRAPA